MITTRNILFFVVAASVAVFLFWYLSDRTYAVKNSSSSGETIIAFGDSLVEGVGSTDGMNFVALLSDRLNIPIINAGKSGDTTSTALARINEDVISKNPKIVLVLLGGNDFLKRVPKRDMLENLERIIGMVHERGAAVILLGVRGGLITDTFESDLQDLARETGSAYVPNVLDGLLGNAQYMDDPIHPNNAGYAIIAERVYPVLEGLLK